MRTQQRKHVKGRWIIRKTYGKRKGESERISNPGLPKKNSNKGTQNENSVLIRCKSTKCHIEHYKFKTKECLELLDKFFSQNREKNKIHELKERNYRSVFRKREHGCWNRKGEDIYINLYRVTNEHTPENQVEWVGKEEKIYNNLFTVRKTKG